MRLIFKTLLFPISLILGVISGVSKFVLNIGGIFTNILSFIFIALGVVSAFCLIFGTDFRPTDTWLDVLLILFIGFLFSRYGLVGALRFTVDKIDDLRYTIKAI